jgi:ADP-ribose pyrophosphatase YjhB (NUDIX family)
VADALDVVRDLFRAINQDDASAAAAFYHPDCRTEHVFSESVPFCDGRAAVEAALASEFSETVGSLPGERRYDVSRIAGMETGWGWVRAEWVSVTAARAGGPARGFSGYSYFWVEDGLIRRQRNIARELPPELVREPKPPSERRYPSRPLVGVGAVVLSNEGKVLLVKRRHEPLAGQWSLPGGMLELGESLEAGVARELFEETGLHVDVGRVVEVFDRILLDDTGRVRYHFVLVDYLCRVRAGTLIAGSDVEDVAWADPANLEPYHLAEKPRTVIVKALSE